MSYTVKEVLTVLKELSLLAGQNGLDRMIRSVTVLDNPYLHEWIVGGELVITTGYIYKDKPQDFKEMLIRLNNAGIACVCIKLGRFIGVLPQDIAEYADEVGLPIISIPLHFRMTDLVNPVLISSINEKAKLIQLSEKIHRSFTELVIEGGSVPQIIETLKSIIKKDVAYYELCFNEHYVTSDFLDIKDKIFSCSLQNIKKRYRNYRVYLEEKDYGYIFLNEDHDSPNIQNYQEIAIEHACTTLILDIQKRISKQQIESKYRDEFVLDLIHNKINSEEELNARSRIYGWDFKKGLIAIIVEIDYFKNKYTDIIDPQAIRQLENSKSYIFSLVKGIIRDSCPDSSYTEFSDSIVFLISPAGKDENKYISQIKRIGERVKERLNKNTEYTVMIGIGNFKSSPIEVYQSFNEALQAVKLGRILYKSNSIVCFDDLEVYRILTFIAGRQESIDFCLQNIGKIVMYDKKKKTDYLNTLSCIVNKDWNLKDAAKELFLHYNTMRYKYKRIMQIIGISDLTPDKKLSISLCMKILDLNSIDDMA